MSLDLENKIFDVTEKNNDQSDGLSGVLNAYLYDRLSFEQKSFIEEKLKNSQALQERLDQKKKEKDLFSQSIPKAPLTLNARNIS